MEDKKIPRHIYEMETDEMVDWLSDSTETSEHSTERSYVVSSKSERNALLQHCILRLKDGEPIDTRVKDYLIENLELVMNEKPAFCVPRGREPIEYVDMRWRACVVRFVNELGASQREIAEIIGISERLISEWVRFARTEVYAYRDTKDFCEELVASAGISKTSYRDIILALSDHKALLIR